MTMKPVIFIDGREGTTGLQIYDRLTPRQDIELLLIDEEKRKDPAERKKCLNAADLVFLCLPDDGGPRGRGHDREPQHEGHRRLHRPPDGGGLGLRLPRTLPPTPGGDHTFSDESPTPAVMPPASSLPSIPWSSWG